MKKIKRSHYIAAAVNWLKQAKQIVGSNPRNAQDIMQGIMCLDKALEIDPKFAEAWSMKGTFYRILGNNSQSLTCYDRALKHDPNLFDALVYKGISMQERRNYYDAAVLFINALQVNPNDQQVVQFRNNVLSRLSKSQKKKLFGGSKNFSKIQAIEQIKSQIRLNHEKCVSLAEGMYEGKTPKLDLNSEESGNFKNAKANAGLNLSGLGVIFEKEVGLKTAIELYSKTLELVPYDLECLIGKAEALTVAERLEDALDCLNDGLKYGDKLGVFMCIYNSEQKTQSVHINTHEKDTTNKIGVLWYNRGTILEKLQKYDEAYESFEKAKLYSEKTNSL